MPSLKLTMELAGDSFTEKTRREVMETRNSDRHIKLINAILDAILVTVLSSRFFGSTTCEKLSTLSLPETTITIANTVAPGKFAWPHDYIGWKSCLFQPSSLPDEPEDAFKNLPTFCRVAATLKPSSDSEIKIEIWMPISGWNAKFMAVGNGGWAGTISYADMGVALLRGYAVASTNTGHDGTFDDASFASGHPEKLIDFGYRAVHEMTAKAKAIITASPAFLLEWLLDGWKTGANRGAAFSCRF